MEPLDLSNVGTADSIEYEILKPGGLDGTGWKWTILGPSHPKAIAYNDEQSRRGLRKARQIEQAQVNGKKYQPEERTPEDVRRENALWITSRVSAWNRIVTLKQVDPEPMSFSDENVVRILVHPEMGWLFTQLVDVLAEDKRFTKASATI